MAMRTWVVKTVVQGWSEKCAICGGPEHPFGPPLRKGPRLGKFYMQVASDDASVTRNLCDACYRSNTERLSLRAALSMGCE
jgi:hypothetical protein